MADLSAFIRSLSQPTAPLVQMDDIGAGARGWENARENRRSNLAQEGLRASEQDIQRSQLAQQQEQFEYEQREKRHQAQTKAAGDLMDALATEDPMAIESARQKAALVGVELDDASNAPLADGPLQDIPLNASQETSDNLSGPVPAKQSIAATEKPTREPTAGKPDYAEDEFGGRLLGKNEEAPWAGNEKPPAWLSRDMAARGKKPQEALGDPPKFLQDYMRGLGVDPLLKPQQASKPEPQPKPVTPDVRPSDVALQEEPEARQQMPEQPEPMQPQQAQRQAVSQRGYYLRADGNTIAHIDAQAVRMRQREMAAEMAAPLVKGARNGIEMQAATTAQAMMADQVGKVGLEKAREAGLAHYYKTVGEYEKNRRTDKMAAARAATAQLGQLNVGADNFNAFVNRYSTTYKLPEIRSAADAASMAAQRIMSDNPVEQKAALGAFAKEVMGPGVLSNQDFQYVLSSGGKWNAIKSRLGEWLSMDGQVIGALPPDWRAQIAAASGEVQRAKEKRMDEIATIAENEMLKAPEYLAAGPQGIQQWQARARIAIAGSETPKEDKNDKRRKLGFSR